MSLEKSVVPIPVGGGLDRAVEEFNLRPNKSQTAENVKTDTNTAYVKHLGYDSVGTASVGVGPVLATRAGDDPSTGHILVTGADGMCQWQKIPQVPVSSNSGYVIPTRVLRHDILSVRGAVTEPNLAHNRGYTAIVASVAENPQLAANLTGAETVVARCVVVDDSWRIVWGPYDVPEIALMPRVEPVLDGTTPGFVFIGLNGPADPTDVHPGLAATTLTISAFDVWASSFSAPSVSTIATTKNHTYNEALSDSSLGVINQYDTHADRNGNRVFLLASQTTDDQLSCMMTQWTAAGHLVTSNHQLVSGTGTTPKAAAIWYRQSSDSFVLYARETQEFWYGAGANTSMTAVAGTFSTSGFPIFYIDNAGLLHMADRTLTFSGIVPTVFSASGRVVTAQRRPVPFPNTFSTSSVFYSNEYGGYNIVQGAAFGEQEGRVRQGGDLDTEVGLVPLNASRRPNFWAIHRYINDGRGMIPGQQDVTASGNVLVPQAIALPNTIAPITFDAWTNLPDNVLGTFISAWGVNNGESWISVSEIEFDTSSHSSQDFFGTQLIAAGQLTAWDGTYTMPAWVDAPRLPFANTLSSVGAVFQNPGDAAYPSAPASSPSTSLSLSGSFIGITTHAHQQRDLAYVLTYTDRNGNAVRSAPLLATAFATDSGSDLLLWDGEYWLVDLTPFNKILQEKGLGLKLEGYASSEYAFGGTSPEDLSLKFRVPLIKFNGAYFAWTRATSDWTADTPLFTLTDIVPARPPATNIIARAGNYAFLVPSEAPYELWNSVPIGNYRLPEWSPELVVHAPPESGGIVSLAGSGDRLYMFCRNGTWELFVGTGPDATGNGSFQAPRKLYSGDGCVSHDTTISGAWGVFYVTQSGPKLIGSDGSYNDIGRAVRSLINIPQLASAQYQEIDREIWLFHKGADGALVYDLKTGSWTSSSLAANQTSSLNGKILRYILSDHDLRLQSDTTATDGAVDNFILGKVVSPWITFDNDLGFKRCRRIGVPVHYLSGTYGSLKISLAYDFVDTNVDSFTYDWTDVLGPPGSGIMNFQKPSILEVRPTRQKFSAIRITVEDVYQDSGGSGDPKDFRFDVRWVLVGHALDVGVKHGMSKVGAEAKK